VTEIRGKAAFVTGAGSGIGRGLAVALADAGASVVVSDILAEEARRVAEEIDANGGAAVAIACDVSDRGSVAQAKHEASEAFGPVLLLFANAGVTSWQRLTEMTESDVDWIFGVNLMGVVNCLQAFLPDMIAARDGHACATSSVAGLCPAWLPYHTAYSATKMGVIGLMLNLRYELAEAGVGASVLVPGPVVSGISRNTARSRPQRFGGPTDARVELPLLAREMVGAEEGFRQPEEVAAMVIRAVRANEPIVLTSSDREPFHKTYVDLVMRGFSALTASEGAP
jgi:NAD(P)-dependent dehydrogenase (short-subunit alcohol dehydrogenase family)